MLCTAAGSAKIDAQAAGSQAAVSIGNDMVSIGNDYISREYSIADGHIKTAQIVNKRIGTNLVPQDGSQDFVINTLGEADTAEPGTPSEDTDKITNEPQWELSTPDAISKEGWRAKLTNSAGTEFPESAVNTLFDNELGTPTWVKHAQPRPCRSLNGRVIRIPITEPTEPWADMRSGQATTARIMRR